MDYYEWGRVTRPHGIRGALQIETNLNEKEFASRIQTVYLEENGRYIPHEITSVFYKKDAVCIQMEGCDDRNAAEALTGKSVYLKDGEPELPKNVNLIYDLEGSEIRDIETGEVLGTLSRVESYPGNDIYVIKTSNGTVLAPALLDVFPSVDAKSKTVFANGKRFRETSLVNEVD